MFRYTPVLRFILDDATERVFWAERVCYQGGIDGWISDVVELLIRPIFLQY